MGKPSIPDRYPPDRTWFKAVQDNLEILAGRRSNRITIPTLSTLTFSSPPTQAECNALEAKLNAVFQLLTQVINRLDS